MQRFEDAVERLEQALQTPPRFQHSWGHIVRQRARQVADALISENPVAVDSWLAARVSHLERERNRLLTRLSVLGSLVSESTDPESVRESFRRLVLDVRHHHQRLNDLAYDAIALDVGGSE
jgi:acyl dehydratase